MPRPPGVRIGISTRDDLPQMYMPRYSRAEDKVWDAVEEAQDAGWTFKQFMVEASQAWKERRREEQRHEFDDIEREVEGE